MPTDLYDVDDSGHSRLPISEAAHVLVTTHFFEKSEVPAWSKDGASSRGASKASLLSTELLFAGDEKA